MKTKIIIMLLALVSAPTMAAPTAKQVSQNEAASYDAADQEMIKLLLLREEQIGGYVRVMQLQRRAFLAVSETQWDQKLKVYEDTVNKLKPVLDDTQIAQFAAYMGCLMEESHQYTQLSME